MPDNPEKSVNPRPDKDRRRHTRQRIHSLSYVKMGDSNGGIVLNISEGGISVQAAAVLDPRELVTMLLEIPRVRNRAEVTGEIAWLSASKKEAGLRFVDLPESTLKQIRKWMAREASPEQFEDETDPLGDEQETPVVVEPIQAAAVETVVMETAVVEPAPDEEANARELSEADIMSADEIKRLESEQGTVHHTTVVEGEEQFEEETEFENEDETADAAEVAANFRDEDEDEAEADVEEESEVEQIAAKDAKASAEIGAEETEAEVQSRDEEEAEEEAGTEDELIQAFGPPVVPFERRPNMPFSSMNALAGGSRSAQNLAIAPPLLHDVQKLFVESYVAPQETAAESGWKVFTIQLQTGWFLAALVLLLALISFIAGMAVRRGALNGVMGEQQDTLIPKISPASGSISRVTPAASGSTAERANAAAAKPLSIEIVDLANHRWVIPASTGANRAGIAQPAETDASSTTSGSANRTKTDETDASQGAGSGQPAANAADGGTAPAHAGTNSGKASVPLVLSLPETPISATGSVAISSQRSVPVPADGSKAAQNGRNLQVGQLINLVEPVYPAEAVQQKIEGTVKLHAVIGTDGVIESLAQVSGPQVLVNASMTAVRNWKYSPTRMNGQPIETQEDISFVFRLPN